jgi:hypothetical protein
MISQEDIDKLNVHVKEVCGGWYTVEITYDGKVIKTVEI